MDAIASALHDATEKLPKIPVKLNEPMRNHTSFRIGGPVRAMFMPNSAHELRELSALLRIAGICPLIIGNGTNLLADDCALDIVVIKTTGLCSMQLTGDTEITAGCGVPLSRLAVYACENELTGLEFAHGIPGTLGGAVTMNAGAYGGEMMDVVNSTDAVSIEAVPFTTVGEEHGFSYRHSRFSDTDDIILSSVIRLQKGEVIAVRAEMERLSVRRRESQPLNLPSAGSTFKRPENGYAAAMIEQAGLKGFAIGGAQVSEKHSGFVVNRGEASFADVFAVMEHVQRRVLQKFGVELVPEIKIIRNI